MVSGSVSGRVGVGLWVWVWGGLGLYGERFWWVFPHTKKKNIRGKGYYTL